MRINWKRKLSRRKLWAAAAGIVTGLAMVFVLDENTISTVVSVSSVVAYILAEGKIDAEGVKNAAENEQDAVENKQDAIGAAKSAKCWVMCDFQPGDVVIYDFSGKQEAAQHCGIVETVLPDYGVQAVEGNTSTVGSQNNGGIVCRKNRAKKFIVGAVRPVFDVEKEDDIRTKAANSNGKGGLTVSRNQTGPDA